MRVSYLSAPRYPAITWNPPGPPDRAERLAVR